MVKKGKGVVVWIVIAVIVVGLIGYLSFSGREKSSKLDSFAQCLTDKGAQFYGAFWCSHCRNQKKMFGSSADKLPYVECSTPNGQEQLQVCKDANIQSYPTWIFKDGSQESGELSLQKLSEKTGCAIPQ